MSNKKDMVEISFGTPFRLESRIKSQDDLRALHLSDNNICEIVVKIRNDKTLVFESHMVSLIDGVEREDLIEMFNASISGIFKEEA